MRITTPLQWLFVVAVTLVMGTPFLLAGLLLRGRTRKGRLFRILSKAYSRVLFAGFRVNVSVRGIDRIEARRPYVFMGNHASNADVLAAAIALPQPLHFVFKKEFARVPLFGQILLALGQIKVDREDRVQSRAALDGAVEGLSGNNSIIIFPEGWVSKDGKLLPLKKSPFRLALRAGLPIVPFRISGAREVSPPVGSGHFFPGTISIDVYPPIPVNGLTESDLPALMESVSRCLSPGGAV